MTKLENDPSLDKRAKEATQLILNTDQLTNSIQANSETTIDNVINESFRDQSPEAKLGRLRMSIRAAYGELMCTLLFYTPIFCSIANQQVNPSSALSGSLAIACVGGFQAIALCFAFSSISGAHFNSAISFALWLTGKLSNRKLIMYIGVQLLASILAMCIVRMIYGGNLETVYDAIAVVPPQNADLGKVFGTEFFFTFILTYVAFTVAFEDAEKQKKDTMSFKSISDSKGLTLYTTTPQSRTGFAPFAIGLTIFSLSMMGGESGGAFNPGRLFGPAIFSGKWDYIYLYWLGELCGSATAGLMVSGLHKFGIIETTPNRQEVSAKQAFEAATKDSPAPLATLPLSNEATLNPVIANSI